MNKAILYNPASFNPSNQALPIKYELNQPNIVKRLKGLASPGIQLKKIFLSSFNLTHFLFAFKKNCSRFSIFFSIL